MRIFYTIIICLIFAFCFFTRQNNENPILSGDTDKQRYLPYMNVLYLPIAMCSVLPLICILHGIDIASRIAISMCFNIFLHICFYYAFLLLALPLLRKCVNARTCAMLWMLPNFLYITSYSYMELPSPFKIIHVPGKIVWLLFYVWLTGFILVLAWKITSHLIFRHKILKDTVTYIKPDMLNLWNDEIHRAKIRKPKFKLVISPNVNTPLSIGIFPSTTRVVLPRRDYTKEELSLIFRHELIHIAREDAAGKFFLTVCTAMCWFNPLMWIAMRKCADDLELSCDETALLLSDDATRRQYANLILCTASDERGFTTCLSASAQTLRYRLKNVMKPKERFSGTIISTIILFILIISCGSIALSYGGYTGAEVIYQSEDIHSFKLISTSSMSYHSIDDYDCIDEEAFHEYMSGLTMSHLTGNYAFENAKRELSFVYEKPGGGPLWVDLMDDIAVVTVFGDEVLEITYHIPDGVDWDYLDTLFIEVPDVPEVDYQADPLFD